MNLQRLLLAVTLMMGVILLTNVLFPPPPPPPVPEAVPERPAGTPAEANPAEAAPSATAERLFGEPEEDEDAELLVEVETPLFRLRFSNYGGALRSAELSEYPSLAREGPVELVPPETGGLLRGTWRFGTDSVALGRFAHRVEPPDGIRLGPGDGPATLSFRYEHPEGAFFSEIRYTFTADSYVFSVEGELPPVERTSIRLDMGRGLAFNEAKENDERQAAALVGNNPGQGVTSQRLNNVDEIEIINGPLQWAAVKSKFFVTVILPAAETSLPMAWAGPGPDGESADVRVEAPVQSSGAYAYRAYAGPIERERLAATADQLEELNPYGWRFFRPVVRPFVGIVLWTITALHERLALGYGLVLIVMGLLMRIVLWPLNQKAMRSNIRMQSMQPMVQELKDKYKDDPQKQKQELMKLYKEQGFNPLAGCLPILLPWPMLIALFLVFQNTIQLRAVPFLWLPDLSAPDPFWIMPVLVGASMLLLQFLTMKLTTGWAAANPQMKMMLFFMPAFMTFIFFNFASGLNLYYATANLATIPQTLLVAKERRKAGVAGRPKPS